MTTDADSQSIYNTLSTQLEYDSFNNNITLIEGFDSTTLFSLVTNILNTSNIESSTKLAGLDYVFVDYDKKVTLTKLFKDDVHNDPNKRVECTANLIISTLKYEFSKYLQSEVEEHAIGIHLASQAYANLISYAHISELDPDELQSSNKTIDPSDKSEDKTSSTPVIANRLMLINLSQYLNGPIGAALQRDKPKDRIYLSIYFDHNGHVLDLNNQCFSFCKIQPAAFEDLNGAASLKFVSCPLLSVQ